MATASGDVQVVTPVGFTKIDQMFRLHVRLTDTKGLPVGTTRGWYSTLVTVVQLDGETQAFPLTQTAAGEFEAFVPRGQYFVGTVLTWWDTDGVNYGVMFDPEVTVSGDTDSTLAATGLERVRVATPRPSESQGVVYSVRGHTSVPGRSLSVGVTDLAEYANVWTSPTNDPTLPMDSLIADTFAERPITMRTAGRNPVDLSVRYRWWGLGAAGAPVRFTGRGSLGLVDAGAGSTEEFAGIDARGKLALIRLDIPKDPLLVSVEEATRPVLNAIAAGARGVVMYSGPDFRPDLRNLIALDIPTVSLPPDQGVLLRDRLRTGRVTLNYEGAMSPAYKYELVVRDSGQIRSRLRVRATGSGCGSCRPTGTRGTD